MQLNHLPDGPGGGGSGGSGPSGKLRSDKAAWSHAGEGVADVRSDIGKAMTSLEHGQTGLGKTTGCLTTVVQKGVYDSWERRLKDISDLCSGLAGVLDKTGHDQLRTDEAIKAEIAKLKVRSEDTSAGGGSGKGR
ncbi:hypothetical protein ACIQB5_01785 [Streptomyces sp. NPDC088560]|uniref:hypothetical protein n=1 Tax=Streptomyces sp. NPDC088560 TaxID=3365868 RepID=UPI0038057423